MNTNKLQVFVFAMLFVVGAFTGCVEDDDDESSTTTTTTDDGSGTTTDDGSGNETASNETVSLFRKLNLTCKKKKKNGRCW